MKGKKNPSSWRDQILEATSPVVTKVTAIEVPADAKINNGEVRVKKDYLGRVVKGNHKLYYPAPIV